MQCGEPFLWRRKSRRRYFIVQKTSELVWFYLCTTPCACSFQYVLLNSFPMEIKALSLLRVQGKAVLVPLALSAGTGICLHTCCARFRQGILKATHLDLVAELILAAACKEMLARPLRLPDMLTAVLRWSGLGRDRRAEVKEKRCGERPAGAAQGLWEPGYRYSIPWQTVSKLYRSGLRAH